MTYAHIWEYVRRRTEDPDRAHTYAREIFCIENGIPKEQEHLVNEEMFSYFEADLEQRGQEMVSKPRNQRFPTKLPNGFALLAIAYGTGRNDYLAVVLGFEPNSGKLVTWSVNYDFGPQKNDEAVCGNGHYFDYRDSENAEAIEEARKHSVGPDEKMDVARAMRDKTLERAWSDYFVRSTILMRNCVRWSIDHGVPVKA